MPSCRVFFNKPNPAPSDAERSDRMRRVARAATDQNWALDVEGTLDDVGSKLRQGGFVELREVGLDAGPVLVNTAAVQYVVRTPGSAV